MTVFLLDCVILSSSCPRKLLALRDVSFLAFSVTMPLPLFFCRLSLRYDMILVTLRVILSFFWAIFTLSFDRLFLLVSNLAFIGLVWFKYCDMLDHISFSSAMFYVLRMLG